jgi:nicotinamide-nucleotide amidase
MPQNLLSIDSAIISNARETVRRLKARNATVVTAESCTAGLVAAAMSQADGASDVLHGGFVTYTKEQKATALGIERPLLDREGAVSATVAERMVVGALERSKADIALAISGVLGPSPDEDGNPVGLVFFSYARRGGKPTTVRRQYGPQEPDRLRRTAVLEALSLLGSAAD